MVRSIPVCSCGASTAISKYFEEQKLIQLLMGLDDSYKIIRGQILMMKPLPTISTAYSLIFQEERQRGITINSGTTSESIAMHVSTDQSALKKTLVCNHCKKPGHTKAQCYRLNGFPANFKFTKSKKDDSKTGGSSSNSSSNASISQDQYHHLRQLLNNSHISSSSTSQANNVNLIDDSMNPEGATDHMCSGAFVKE